LKSSTLLNPKEFDAKKHKKIIRQLRPHMDLKKFKEKCCPIAKDILENYDGFEKVKKGPKFTGTPFDLFGFKNGDPGLVMGHARAEIALKNNGVDHSFLTTW
jgi:hypothetical protein